MVWTVDCGEFMVVATPQPAAAQMTLVWTVAEADRCTAHEAQSRMLTLAL